MDSVRTPHAVLALLGGAPVKLVLDLGSRYWAECSNQTRQDILSKLDTVCARVTGRGNCLETFSISRVRDLMLDRLAIELDCLDHAACADGEDGGVDVCMIGRPYLNTVSRQLIASL